MTGSGGGGATSAACGAAGASGRAAGSEAASGFLIVRTPNMLASRLLYRGRRGLRGADDRLHDLHELLLGRAAAADLVERHPGLGGGPYRRALLNDMIDLAPERLLGRLQRHAGAPEKAAGDTVRDDDDRHVVELLLAQHVELAAPLPQRRHIQLYDEDDGTRG